MAEAPYTQDRNFDDLAAHYENTIYGGLKGDLRLAVLARDFGDFLPVAPYVPMVPGGALAILDAGGGQGRFSIPLAAAGHTLTLCDISARMLALADERVRRLQARDRVRLVQAPIQSLAFEGGFDLVLCHAVMEWMASPEMLLPALVKHLRPGGYLSLIFYNHHGLVYKNLMRGNPDMASIGASTGGLTPVSPQRPEAVLEQCRSLGLELVCHSGIRVFHDYLPESVAGERDPAVIRSLELKYSRQSPYRDLARYVHLMVRRPYLEPSS